MWEPLDLVAQRGILRLYAQYPVDMVTGTGVTRSFAALGAVVSPAAEDTVDCKC